MSDAPRVDVKGSQSYELRSNSRVHDAIYKAGRMTADANNQSRSGWRKNSPKSDSMLLKKERMFNLEVRKFCASSAPAEKTGKVHLNRATNQSSRQYQRGRNVPRILSLSRSKWALRGWSEKDVSSERKHWRTEIFHGGLKTFLFAYPSRLCTSMKTFWYLSTILTFDQRSSSSGSFGFITEEIAQVC